jgi:hypothetical protein
MRARSKAAGTVMAESIAVSEVGFVRGVPLMLLRVEGVMVFCACLWAYRWLGDSWWLFAALFLVPDVSMLGYLANPRIGAVCYNAVHTGAGPALLALAGVLTGGSVLFSLAVIWLAHLGFDRMLGYGLKYATGFGDTHLGRIGRARV